MSAECYYLYKLKKPIPNSIKNSLKLIQLSERFVLINWSDGKPDPELKREYLQTFVLSPLVVSEIVASAMLLRKPVTFAITRPIGTRGSDDIGWSQVKEAEIGAGRNKVKIRSDGVVCFEDEYSTRHSDVVRIISNALEKWYKEELEIP